MISYYLPFLQMMPQHSEQMQLKKAHIWYYCDKSYQDSYGRPSDCPWILHIIKDQPIVDLK